MPYHINDWDAAWCARRLQLLESGAGSCAGLWAKKEDALRYAESAVEEWGDRIDHIIDDLDLKPGMTLLDIGAGTGFLEEKLFETFASATAVEPADGMRAVMEERFRSKGIGNVMVISKLWEDVTPRELHAPYDRVVCAFALGMLSLKAAVHKMNDVCRGRVHLYWFTGETSWQSRKRRIWPHLHGKEIPPQTEGDMVYNVLYHENFPVEVKRYTYKFTNTFMSQEDLIEQNRVSYDLKNTDLEKIFIDCISNELIHDGNTWRLPGYACFASYSWQTAG